MRSAFALSFIAAAFFVSRIANAEELPNKLAITIVSENAVATLERRVSSWFHDGTEVHVISVKEVDQQRLLSANAGEVSAWIVPLSKERAIVAFSSTNPARYLVREVRLREGLDEVGLERLASVVHSAFVALREGAEGFERAHAERELGDAGLVVVTPPPKPPPPPPPAPAVFEPIPKDHVDTPLPTQTSPSSSTALLFGVGYGGRARGAEGLGQGPKLTIGVKLPSRTPITVGVSGHYLLPSDFEADAFNASVQTTAARVAVGVEPALGASSYSAQAIVSAGADVARIQSTGTNALAVSAEAGTQWRSVGELTLGILRHSGAFDLGLSTHVTFAFADIHYSATTTSGERRLVAPWAVQPGLSLFGRFRSVL